MNEVNNLIELIKHLHNEGILTTTGDIYINGELTIDVDDSFSEWGFIGRPNEYGARKHEDAEAVLTDWLRSDDPFKRKAASNFPRMFVFVDDQEQFDAMSDITEGLFRKNHNKWFRASQIGAPRTKQDEAVNAGNALFEFKDLGGQDIEGHMFVSLGNYNFPKTKGREEWLTERLNIKEWVLFILQERYDELLFGSLLFKKRR